MSVINNTGLHTFTSVTDVNNPIVGSWYLQGGGQAQDSAVATFLADGEFFFATVGNSVLDPSGQNGIERGTYTWNSATGAFTDIVLLDTNGQWGLSHSTITGITVTGNQMAFSFTDTGTPNGTVLHPTRVVSAVPLPAAAWLYMTGLMGLFYSVKKKARGVGQGNGALAVV
jgi:hypothetical protein